MAPSRKREWVVFGNNGLRRALDLSKLCVVELDRLPTAGLPDGPERLHLYFGCGDSPVTVMDSQEIKTLLEALGLEGLGKQQEVK